jgi:hypothetical protein
MILGEIREVMLQGNIGLVAISTGVKASDKTSVEKKV